MSQPTGSRGTLLWHAGQGCPTQECSLPDLLNQKGFLLIVLLPVRSGRVWVSCSSVRMYLVRNKTKQNKPTLISDNPPAAHPLSLCKVGVKSYRLWKSGISFVPCEEWGQIQSNEGGTAMWQSEGAKQKVKISLTVGKLPLDMLTENWKCNPRGELTLNAGVWELWFANDLLAD